MTQRNYEKPELTVYGDIKQVTLALGNAGTDVVVIGTPPSVVINDNDSINLVIP